MISKFVIFLTFAIFLTGIYTQINTCSNLGTSQPRQSTDCTSFNNSTDRSRCCFISASAGNTTLTACFKLPSGSIEAIAQAAASKLGVNGTYTCSSVYLGVSLIISLVISMIF